MASVLLLFLNCHKFVFHNTDILLFAESETCFLGRYFLLKQNLEVFNVSAAAFTGSRCFTAHNLSREKSALHHGPCPSGHMVNKKKLDLMCQQEDRHLICYCTDRKNSFGSVQ